MIGRKEEIATLLRALSRRESQFIAVYGRRRVGKTYLVRNAFGNEFAFYHTGIFDGSFRDQLDEFKESLEEYGLADCPPLANWRDAFRELRRLLSDKPNEKKVVFIDELPWMDTWTFSAPCFTVSDESTFFSAPVTAKRAYKKGKKTYYETIHFVLLVTPSDVGGVVTMTGEEYKAMTVHGQQNLWGSTYKKLGAKLFVSGKKNKYKVYNAKMTYHDGSDWQEQNLSIKVTTAGKATVSMKYDTGKKKNGKKVYWSTSCSTTVWPSTLPDDASFRGRVYYYIPYNSAYPEVSGHGDYCVIVEE